MSATDIELRLRASVNLVNIEINIIITNTTDYTDTNTQEFYRQVEFLQTLNIITDAPRINDAIKTLVENCQTSPETLEKFTNLSQVTNEFLMNICL